MPQGWIGRRIELTLLDLVDDVARLGDRLSRIEARLGTLNQRSQAMAGELDDLQREVSENNDATQSAITLLNGLKAALDAAIASGDMSRVKALSDQLSNQTDALAAAVAQNTPAA